MLVSNLVALSHPFVWAASHSRCRVCQGRQTLLLRPKARQVAYVVHGASRQCESCHAYVKHVVVSIIVRMRGMMGPPPPSALYEADRGRKR